LPFDLVRHREDILIVVWGDYSFCVFFHKMLSHVFYHVFTIPWICISLIIKVWYSDIPIHTNIKIPYQFLTIIKSCLLEIHLSERNCVNKKIKMKIKQFAIIESTHAKIWIILWYRLFYSSKWLIILWYTMLYSSKWLIILWYRLLYSSKWLIILWYRLFYSSKWLIILCYKGWLII
jgi:hypothetical protein